MDAVLLSTACVVGASRDGALQVEAATAAVVTTMAAWLFIARALHQYDCNNGRGAVGDLALTVLALAASLLPLAILGLVPTFAATFDSRAAFVTLLLPGLVARWLLVGSHLWSARPPEQVLVVGSGPLGRLTGNQLVGPGPRRHLLGYLRFENEPPEPRLHAPVLGLVGELETTLKDIVVDEVYFASTAPGHATQVQHAIHACESFGVPFAIPACPYRFERATPADPKSFPDGYVHFLSARPKRMQQMLKRLLDISLSGSALVLLAPLLLATAAAVKLSSKGPVLFRQTRVGFRGRHFDMLKFRSMVADAEVLKAKLLSRNEQDGPVFKMRNDPRVTALGRLMRKYSVDELPQLLNVLRGDMSIVGPRPPIPAEVARYAAWQRRRLSVRPGLTCVWQVSGRNEISFEHWMLLDMRYIDHWSILADLSLVLRTVPVVLTGRGAS